MCVYVCVHRCAFVFVFVYRRASAPVRVCLCASVCVCVYLCRGIIRVGGDMQLCRDNETWIDV